MPFKMIISFSLLVPLMEIFLTAFWIELDYKREKRPYDIRVPSTLEIETYEIPEQEMSTKESNGSQIDSRPTSGTTQSSEVTEPSPPLTQFVCGNPTVEKVEGIIHFYKEK